jgi:hypothetical protein
MGLLTGLGVGGVVPILTPVVTAITSQLDKKG